MPDATRGGATHVHPHALHSADATQLPAIVPQHWAARAIGAVARETAAPIPSA